MRSLIFVIFFSSQFLQLAQADDLMSRRVEMLLENKVTHSGPNCWNSVLYVTGLNSGLRQVSKAEFHFLMESLACERVDKKEDVRPGDIHILRRSISYLTPFKREVHASVWLSSDTLFSKKTVFFTSKYEVLPEESVLDVYLITPESKRFTEVIDGIHTPKPCVEEECINYIEYRRCKSRDEILKNLTFNDLDLMKKVEGIEKIIDQQVLSPEAITIETRDLLKSKVDDLKRIYQNQCESGFVCGYIETVLLSFVEQFRINQPSPLSKVLN